MTNDEILGRIAKLRSDIVAQSRDGQSLKRPRKMRLAVVALQDPVVSAGDGLVSDAWEELLILFRCARRLKVKDTHRRLSQMQSRYAKTDRTAQFNMLFRQVKEVLAPDFITPHGYNRTFASIDKQDHFQTLATVLAPILAKSEPVLLYAGSLLGYVRDGKPVEHDDDIDVAVYLGDHPAADIPTIWHDYKRSLLGKGLLTEKWAAWDTPVIKLEGDDGMTIDLFPCWSHQGKFTVYPYSWGGIGDESIFPLQSFEATDLMLPANTDAFLEQCYGKSWRIPDPLFHFNWRQANRKFRVLKSHNYSVE